MGLVLQPYWSPGVQGPGPGGQGGGHRLRRRPHPRPTSTARSSRGWPTRCARAGSAASGAAACRSPSCASPAAGRRATRRCRSPPTSSACRRRGRTSTRPPGWARRSTPRWASACTRDFETAVAAMTRVGASSSPTRRRRELYDGLYRRVYRRCTARLRPLYEEIREITGVPRRGEHLRAPGPDSSSGTGPGSGQSSLTSSHPHDHQGDADQAAEARFGQVWRRWPMKAPSRTAGSSRSAGGEPRAVMSPATA